jgi:hypothetical protein
MQIECSLGQQFVIVIFLGNKACTQNKKQDTRLHSDSIRRTQKLLQTGDKLSNKIKKAQMQMAHCLEKPPINTSPHATMPKHKPKKQNLLTNQSISTTTLTTPRTPLPRTRTHIVSGIRVGAGIQQQPRAVRVTIRSGINQQRLSALRGRQ